MQNLPDSTTLTIHRSEPEPTTTDVEVGVSASGKLFYTVKVRNATTPAEAVRLAQEAREQLVAGLPVVEP